MKYCINSTVSISSDPSIPTLRFPLDRNMRWTVEPGDFEIRIGSSSEDIRLRETISMKGSK